MKNRFEKELRDKAYSAVPDRWAEIKNEARSILPENTKKVYPVKAYIAAAACLCVVIASVVIFKGISSDKIGVIGTSTTLNSKETTVQGDATAAALTERISDDITKPPESDTTESGTSYFCIPYVWWAGDLPPAEEPEFDSSVKYIGDSVRLHVELVQAFDEAEENTELAFVVTVSDNTDYIKKYPELVKARDEAKNELDETAEKCVEKYMAQGDVSYEEASARKFNDEEFIKAREKYREANGKLETAILLARYENNKGAIAELEKYGFYVAERDEEGALVGGVIDARNEKYQSYLSAYGGLAVMVGTKTEILSLEKADLNYTYMLYAAAENADEYEYTDAYSRSEVNLMIDTNISVELMQAYEKSNGEPMRVKLTIGYFGEEMTVEEIRAAAFKEIGMTEEEFNQNGTVDDLNRYREAFNRLTYHTDYYEEAAERLFKDGELVEVNPVSASLTADLTYERALELLENKEVAYIRLEGEGADFSDGIMIPESAQ